MMAAQEESSPKNWIWPARITGAAFVLLFLGLTRAGSGFRIDCFPDFSVISQGELMLWIGHALLLLPGTMLLGAGFSSQIAYLLKKCVARCEALEGAGLIVGLAVLLVAATGVARLGNALVFQGYPVTDDEYAVKFGGQVLASGAVTVPEPPFVAAMPTRYFHFRDGAMTSMDWLGPQVVWAIAESTGTGNLIWSILAGIGLVSVSVASGRLLGRQWALVAAAVFGFSPMALALSMSTHAHLASRAFFAVAIVLLIEAIRRGDDWRLWCGFGLAVAISFDCRPFETGFLALPIGVDLVWRALRRRPESMRALAGVMAGAALPLLVFALHSWAVTGHPLVPPRFDMGASIPESLPVSSTWGRFGNGVAFNSLMLAVWFLGPLGVVLVLVGAWANRVTRLLSMGVVSVLGLGLLHDNFGIHTVGPIHYSECAVPLTLLATQGLYSIRGWLQEHTVSFATVASAVCLGLVVGLGVFSGFTLRGIQRQSEIQAAAYRRIDTLVPGHGTKAIVLAPQFASVWRNDVDFAATGSWVFDWRRPRPDFEDDVLILHDTPDVTAELRRRFPDRSMFRLVLPATGFEFRLVPVTEP